MTSTMQFFKGRTTFAIMYIDDSCKNVFSLTNVPKSPLIEASYNLLDTRSWYSSWTFSCSTCFWFVKNWRSAFVSARMSCRHKRTILLNELPTLVSDLRLDLQCCSRFQGQIHFLRDRNAQKSISWSIFQSTR